MERKILLICKEKLVTKLDISIVILEVLISSVANIPYLFFFLFIFLSDVMSHMRNKTPSGSTTSGVRFAFSAALVLVLVFVVLFSILILFFFAASFCH